MLKSWKSRLFHESRAKSTDSRKRAELRIVRITSAETWESGKMKKKYLNKWGRKK